MIQFSSSIYKKLQRDLLKLNSSQIISIRTYKNDRGFKILKVKDDCFELTEEGFFSKHDTNLKLSALLKLLDKNLDREFPRSHKVRYISPIK